jgi:hypothetical protein
LGLFLGFVFFGGGLPPPKNTATHSEFTDRLLAILL